jgi:predicted O-methyltransferase YrrM
MSRPALKLFPHKSEDRTYRPSFEFDADNLGERHLAAEEGVRHVPGWLRSEDALKLYELAYFVKGPILEIGSYHGKSVIIMAGAARDSGRGATVYSLDIDANVLRDARKAAAEHGIADNVIFVRGSARAFCRAWHGFEPSLVFLDGDHSYRGVSDDLEVLSNRVPNGALVLFHDFNDPLDGDPRTAEVAVREAALDSRVAEDCDFGGVFGACGLFVRRRGGPAPESSPLLVDLLALDLVRMQYLQRVRRPLGRSWRRLRSMSERPCA